MLRASDLLTALAAIGLTIAPVGESALVLGLLGLIDVAVALLIGRRIAARRAKPEPSLVVVHVHEGTPVQLRRRTEPGLRGRRPGVVVEMQERWRQAAEAYRRAAKAPDQR